MNKAVVDTNVLIGYLSKKDQFHEPASEIFHAMDRQDLPRGVLIPQTLFKVLHPLQKREGHAEAARFFEGLRESSGFEVEWVSRENFTKAEGAWTGLNLGSNGPELGDTIIAEHMRSREIEYIYSFDDDFDHFDHVTRLNERVNPFSP